MFAPASNTGSVKNTSPGVVLPFYVYAAVSFFVSAILLCFSTEAFKGHYFHPQILAVTHSMALGWGTMIILGASHQLVPVMIEGRLFSERLAVVSFLLAAVGIPLLVVAFYRFQLDWMARTGGWLINLALLTYLINLAVSIRRSKSENVHAVFVFTAAVWLLITTALGLLLVYNFVQPVLPADSIHYLALHAHMGIVGWFLLLVMGVGTRLIPMFLISKYHNAAMLWWMYLLVNGGLLLFVLLFLFQPPSPYYLVPLFAVLAGVFLFGTFCYRSRNSRLRKKVDKPVGISILSVLMILLPLLLLLGIIILAAWAQPNERLVLAYGFTIFFGWLTAIILGMTFKTLPFIIWNRAHRKTAASSATPNPKELFSARIFSVMAVVYLAGLTVFTAGILSAYPPLLATGAVLLVAAAFLYNLNVFKLLSYSSVKNGSRNQ